MASKLQKMKRSGAVAGACSALAMGILGGSQAVQHQATYLSDDPQVVEPPSQDMTTEGQTVTRSSTPSTLETSFATPGITTTPTSTEPG